MTDRDHELIADYVLGELDDATRRAVESRLRTDVAFAAEVGAMEAAVALAVQAETAPAKAPPHLRTQVMALTESAAPVTATRPDNHAVFPFWNWLGWGVAAALAVALVVTGQRLDRRTAEAESLQGELIAARDRLETITTELTTAVTEQGELVRRIAALESRRSLDQLRIAALSSQLEQANAYGVAVFDPESDEGVIEVINLPPIDGETQDYQLWVVDPQYPNPVDGGVIEIDDEGHTRVRFQARQPVSEVAAFAVSLERKGGVPVAEGPMILVGAL